MPTKNNNHKIIFGLKVKQLRMEQGLSFAELSKASGLSVSYLNEIEKGKKYPKEAKIITLAKALGTNIDSLRSLELSRELKPVGDLLRSNFLNELPLELFGIELSKVVDIIANAPLKVGAFISTLVELSRTYAVHEENFYFRALRAYQELHNNYFEDIEREAIRFVRLNDIPIGEAVPADILAKILEDRYEYTIIMDGLDDYPKLKSLRSVYDPKRKRLYLDSKLNNMQRAFQYAKELGFNFLKLAERPYTSSFHKVNSFEEVLNNYKAGYFAVAILINKEAFVKDLKNFLGQSTWKPELLLAWVKKYQASSSVLFQRFNLLPRYFGLDNVFFIRFFHHLKSNIVEMDKELHLNKKHRPHSNGLEEHYCRRWLSLSLLNKLKDQQNKENTSAYPLFGIQRTRYYDSNEEYLCVTIARPSYPSPNKNASITIGVLIDEKALEVLKFLDDPNIPSRTVNVTCERCAAIDCKERVVPPIFIQKRDKKQAVEDSLKNLLDG